MFTFHGVVSVLALCSRQNEASVLDLTHLDGELGLEEVDVLGEVERVFARVSDHVGVEHVVRRLEHLQPSRRRDD